MGLQIFIYFFFIEKQPFKSYFRRQVGCLDFTLALLAPQSDDNISPTEIGWQQRYNGFHWRQKTPEPTGIVV